MVAPPGPEGAGPTTLAAQPLTVKSLQCHFDTWRVLSILFPRDGHCSAAATKHPQKKNNTSSSGRKEFHENTSKQSSIIDQDLLGKQCTAGSAIPGHPHSLHQILLPWTAPGPALLPLEASHFWNMNKLHKSSTMEESPLYRCMKSSREHLRRPSSVWCRTLMLSRRWTRQPWRTKALLYFRGPYLVSHIKRAFFILKVRSENKPAEFRWTERSIFWVPEGPRGCFHSFTASLWTYYCRLWRKVSAKFSESCVWQGWKVTNDPAIPAHSGILSVFCAIQNNPTHTNMSLTTKMWV